MVRKHPLTTRPLPGRYPAVISPAAAIAGTPFGEMEAAEGRSIRQLTPEEVEKMRVVCRMGREVRAPTRAG
eukprot:COSAG04_NODE_987_length_8947_cov_6.409245_1_plen_71_part_00